MVGGWSWQHGRFDGQSLAVVYVLLIVAALVALRDIDSQRFTRMSDPRPLPDERGRQ